MTCRNQQSCAVATRQAERAALICTDNDFGTHSVEVTVVPPGPAARFRTAVESFAKNNQVPTVRFAENNRKSDV